jgi:hypothetical protein
MNIKPYREIFQDVRYRAEQYGFIVQSEFNKEKSVIQVKRKKDEAVIFRFIDEIKVKKSDKNLQSEIFRSQKSVYSHFVSYMAFYGLFTVSASYDQEMHEKKMKEKEKMLNKKETKKE